MQNGWKFFRELSELDILMWHLQQLLSNSYLKVENYSISCSIYMYFLSKNTERKNVLSFGVSVELLDLEYRDSMILFGPFNNHI